ncbi:MAG: helix-turn-helix transcriptional regulator [Cyanobacteria bacterium J06638_20]
MIKQLREAKTLSQRDIALRLNVTDKAVSNWERGVNQPRLEAWQFHELCLMLECQLSDLVPEKTGGR